MAVNVGLLAPLGSSIGQPMNTAAHADLALSHACLVFSLSAYCELAKSETPGTLSLIDILHLSLVVVLVTALGIFSSIYRRRKAVSPLSLALPRAPRPCAVTRQRVVATSSLTCYLPVFPPLFFISRPTRPQAEAVDSPWFPTHSARDMYITLLSTEPAPPESLIKSALLLRAMTDVKRIMKMRDDKAALSILIGKGAVGDDLLARFQRAEKELEAEILDVVNEANSFTPAWGPGIFQTASEMGQWPAERTWRMLK